MKPQKVSRVHTGSERVEVRLEYAPDEVAQIWKMTPDEKIVPERIDLVWERRVGEEWRRVVGRDGSKAWGHQKVNWGGARGPFRSREIFTKDLTNILRWADYLMPGLRQAIADAEAELPE